MINLSMSAVFIIAISKAVLFLYVIGIVYLIWRKADVRIYIVFTTLALALWYMLFAWPLKTMWWGNTGDENIILASLVQVLHGNLFRDFYHAWLPPYYPPLYFWVTGSIARLFTTHAVAAAKIGVLLTLIAWFILPTAFSSIYRKITSNKEVDPIVHMPWFWFLAPLVFLWTIDFDTILTKPYEVFPALLVVLLAGLCGYSLQDERWGIGQYLFFGILGGLLFMTFYFWFFFVGAALLSMAFASPHRKRSLLRLIGVGGTMLIIASPYLVPLLLSYSRYGIENWQGHYFVPSDFATVLPWDISIRGVLALAGLAGLIFGSKRHPFVRTTLMLLIFCYLYQGIGVLQFIIGMVPVVPSKPFPFLANACLAIGAAWGACIVVQNYGHRFSSATQRSIATIVFIMFVSQMPFAGFIDSPKILMQVQSDLDHMTDASVAQAIISSVPDYLQRTWLVSDVPTVSGLVSLSYYISFNQHYSHHASQFSKRFDLIKRLSAAGTPEEFDAIIDQGSPQKIDALAFYSPSATSDYLLYFWVDNYPNGGREQIISIPRQVLQGAGWDTRYVSHDWTILTRQ